MNATRLCVATALAVAMALIVSPGARVEAVDGLVWDVVTIPGLPAGASATRVWTDQPDNVYVWGARTLPGTTDVPEGFLFHWNGTTWAQELHLSGYSPGALFGTGPADIYASASGCYRTSQAACVSYEFVIYRFDGVSWTPELLPASGSVYSISGVPGDVIASAPYRQLLRNTGAGWSVVYTGTQIFNVLLLSPTEGHYTGCNTRGWWNGTAWNSGDGLPGCDMYDLWGMRDASNALHMYTVGNPTHSIGVGIWRFSEITQSYALVYSDPPGFDGSGAGSAFGIWGSAPDNVFVVGQRAGAGAVYRFDGIGWQRETGMGPIPVVSDVWGSSFDDAWFTLADGRLLHLRPPDTTPPLITYSVDGTIGANGWYVSDVSMAWTVADPESAVTIGDGCEDTSVDYDTAGVMLSCQATSEGGTATESVTLKVDRTPPVLGACPVAGPFLLGSGAHSVGPIDVNASLSGLDAGASALTRTVETSTVGSQPVTFTAQDNAGNVASQACSYEVIFDWSGFFEPVQNRPVINQVKAGQAVPVRFSLGGDQGLAVLAAGSPTSMQVVCESSAPIDDIEPSVTAGNSSLSYDAFGGRYTYVWKTDKGWTGTCRQLSVTLSDGTEHLATFKFR